MTATLSDSLGTQLKALTATFKVSFTAPTEASSSVNALTLNLGPTFKQDLEPVILAFGNSTTWPIPEIAVNLSDSIKSVDVEFLDDSHKFMAYDKQGQQIKVDGESMEERNVGQHWI